MPLRSTTSDENITAYFQGKFHAPFGAQQNMKIEHLIYKINSHSPPENNK